VLSASKTVECKGLKCNKLIMHFLSLCVNILLFRRMSCECLILGDLWFLPSRVLVLVTEVHYVGIHEM